MDADPVVHRPGCFELEVAGHRCVLTYVRQGARVVFNHTGVPPTLRGRGLAARLVAAGLAWAAEEGLEVVPACSYVADYLARHPLNPPP